MCRAATTDAIGVRCDVAPRSEGEAWINGAVDTCGRIDGSHNNASLEGVSAMLVDDPEDVWDRVIDRHRNGV
jgi:NAD(P)-dependent dehydrogenase (short-subunit alcohol dehydrogenase family)